MARVLIVDDHDELRSLVRTYLTKEEHEVLTAADAFEAMSILNTVRVDLALIDINMPYTNGYDMVKMLKRSIRFKNLPIAFITARSDASDIKRAGQLDVDGYIVKPFKRDDFVKKVTELLKLKPNREELAVSFDDGKDMYTDAKVLHKKLKVVGVTEVGVSVLAPYKIANEDELIELDMPLFESMGLENVPALKVLSTKKEAAADGSGGVWRISLMFTGANHEFSEKVKQWIKSTNRKAS